MARAGGEDAGTSTCIDELLLVIMEAIEMPQKKPIERTVDDDLGKRVKDKWLRRLMPRTKIPTQPKKKKISA
jgi:hypothetical protein